MAPKRERSNSPTNNNSNNNNNKQPNSPSSSSSPMKLSSSPIASTSTLPSIQQQQQQSPTSIQQQHSPSPNSTPPSKQINNNSNSNNNNSNNSNDNNNSPKPSNNTRNSPSTTTNSLPNNTPPRQTNSSPSNNNQNNNNSPSPNSASSSAASSSSSTTSSSPSSSKSIPQARRVKLYRLQDDQWLDLGTGSCVGNYIIDSSQSNLEGHNNNIGNGNRDSRSMNDEDEGAFIVVTREPEAGKPSEIILKCKVQPYPNGYLSDEDDEEDSTTPKVSDAGGYQRQQDTLIVWTDKETEIEMALSFATTAGCTEIWEFIKAARRLSEQAPASPSISSPSSPPQPFPLYSITKLPEPSLGNIELVEQAIRTIGRTAAGRERTAVGIIKGNFIQKLIKIQEEAEDLESLDDLHGICRVMQTILLLNDNVIFDLILRDEIVLGVASILEYDPEFPTMKASYRSHLSDPTQFTQIIPIRSPTLLAKIHQTHRLHYFKDVVLARILEDSTFSMLNSAIYFNEVDIVNEVAGDAAFLRELFGIFDEEEEEEITEEETILVEEIIEEETKVEGLIGPSLVTIGPQLPPHLVESTIPLIAATKVEDKMDIDESTSSHFKSKTTTPSTTTNGNSNSTSTLPPATPTSATTTIIPPRDRKHDAILFLQQFTTMAKNLQLPARAAFFKNLVEKGLLRVIEVSLSRTITREDPIMRAATIEILMMLVDHDPNNVRGYSLKQHGLGKRPLVVFLIELFHSELDLGLKAQMSEALRVLVDAGGNGGPLEAPPRLRPEDPEAEKFLQYFYDNCILSLLAPILALPEQSASDPPLELAPHSVALSSHLCDLLCFFVSHHTFRSKYFVLSTSISTNVAKLFRARHKHLRLAALRYFRACVGKNDDFYNRFLIKNLLLDPIMEMIAEEGERDNLLSSACLEFFEYVRLINGKALINHLMERSGTTIRNLSEKGLVTFGSLILKWEQNNEPPPAEKVVTGTEETATTPTSKGMSRERGNWTRMDTEEEESYFNESDEEEDSTTISTTTTTTSKKREGDSELDSSDSNSSSKKVKLDEGNPNLNGGFVSGSSLIRSQTWPSDTSKGKGKSLVEYGEEEEDEDEEEDLTPGGFIREKSSTSTSNSSTTDSTTDAVNLDRHTREAAPPPSPTLGRSPSVTNGLSLPSIASDATDLETTPSDTTPTTTTIESDVQESTPSIPEFMSRKKEEEEDDSLGLLFGKGKKVSPSSSSTSTPKITFGASKVLAGTGSSTTTTSTPAIGAIKMSFGGGIGKFLNVESEVSKEDVSKDVKEDKKES